VKATEDFRAVAVEAVSALDSEPEPLSPNLAALRRRLAAALWGGEADSRSRRLGAIGIADVLQAHGVDLAAAERMDQTVWLLAASLAKVPAFTTEVRNRTLAVLRDREANADPFASFGGPKAVR
jgi:hypothetical protein